MRPASMPTPPNQIRATLEMLMVNVVIGSISACQRPAVRAASETALLASANRCCSNGSRANARTTRIPDNSSRSTRLMPSIRCCMLRKIGSIRDTMR